MRFGTTAPPVKARPRTRTHALQKAHTSTRQPCAARPNALKHLSGPVAGVSLHVHSVALRLVGALEVAVVAVGHEGGVAPERRGEREGRRQRQAQEERQGQTGAAGV